MKLTESDREYLKECGYLEENFEQIERATRRTVYTLIRAEGAKEKISCSKAVELLGRKIFLSGISRSAFHYNSTRYIENSNDWISFDSSKLFK